MEKDVSGAINFKLALELAMHLTVRSPVSQAASFCHVYNTLDLTFSAQVSSCVCTVTFICMNSTPGSTSSAAKDIKTRDARVKNAYPCVC